MSGMDEKEFFGRIRRALGREAPRAPGARPEIPDRLFAPDDSELSPVERFRRAALEAGAEVEIVRLGQVAETVESWLRRLEAVDLAWGISDSGGPIARALADLAVRRIDPGDREGLFRVPVGITDARFGVARSGSLLIESTAGRSPSLVPPVHLVLIEAARILPDLQALMRSLDVPTGEPGASARVLITGPSKTADIEGILITGVHGPGRLIILVVEDA